MVAFRVLATAQLHLAAGTTPRTGRRAGICICAGYNSHRMGGEGKAHLGSAQVHCERVHAGRQHSGCRPKSPGWAVDTWVGPHKPLALPPLEHGWCPQLPGGS